MKIAVLMKQVPASATLGVDPETGNLIRNGETLINPADERALSLALSVTGAQVSVITMGPESAKDLLRTAAAYKVQDLVLVSDRAFAGSDSFQTTRVLKATLEYLGGFDLILCGNRAVDGETGQVGPELCAMMDIPFCEDAVSITLDGETLTVKSQNTEGEKTVSCALPMVVSTSVGAPILNPPSILGLRRAAKAEFRILTNEDLQLDNTGLNGSPTRVARTRTAQVVKRKSEKVTDAKIGAERILAFLSEVEHG